MSIVRYYNPYRNARALRKLTDDFFSETVRPAVDIAETEDEYIFELAVPGFTKDEITIEATIDELTISAEKIKVEEETTENENKEENDEDPKPRYIRKERRETSYRRSFSFNKPIDPSKAQVHLENGILTITVAKADETKPVKLAIEAAN